MKSCDDREDALKALRRMVVYVRIEAARLRVTDAALLLEYAEDAIVLRGCTGSEDTERDDRARRPAVQH